eukprot:103213_1
MTTLVKPTKWMNLALLPNNKQLSPQTITSINAYEFIVSFTQPCVGTPKLFKYNIDSNKFIECMHGNTLICHGNIAFNKQQQILYIYNSSKNQIVSINIKTNTSNSFPCVKNGNYFLFINNCFHVINMHDHHWIGSIQNKSLNTLHTSINIG